MRYHPVKITLLCTITALLLLARAPLRAQQHDISTENGTNALVAEQVHLNITEYIVADTGAYENFRLYVVNPTDSLVVIERVTPSCGCILTTVQKNFAKKNQDGEIYIGIVTERMSELQPFTVDVYTNRNHGVPLRLYIRKKATLDNNEE